MNPQTDFVVGKQSKTHWSAVYGYMPDNKQVQQERGYLYALIDLQTSIETDSLEKIVALSLDELQRYLYEEELKESYLDHVEASVYALKKRLETIVGREKELAEQGIEFEVTVSVMVQNFAYFVTVGNGNITLQRDEKVIDIANILIDSEMAGFLKSGSMMLEDSDAFLLTTSKVAKESELILSNILESFDIHKKTSDFIHKPGVAGLLIADENVWARKQEAEAKAKADAKAEAKAEADAQAKESAIVPGGGSENVQNEDSINSVEQKGEQETKDTTNVEELPHRADTNNEDQEESIIQQKQNAESKKDGVDKFGGPTDDKFSNRFTNEEEGSTVEQARDLAANTFASTKQIVSKGLSRVRRFVDTKVMGHFRNNKRTYAQMIRNVASTLGNTVARGIELFKVEVLGIGSVDRRNVYDKARRIKRNRRIFIVVLLFSVFGGYFLISGILADNRRDAERKEIEESLTSLQSDYSVLESEVLAARTLGADKKQEVLNELDSFIARVNSQASEEYLAAEFDDLVIQAQDKQDDLLLIDRINQPEVIVDFGSLFEAVNLTDLEYSNGSIFVSDAERNVVYKAGVTLQASPQEHISALTEPQHLITTSTGEVVLYDKNIDSVIGRFSPTEPDSLNRFSGLFSYQDVGNAAEVGLYEPTDGLYELKTGSQQIYVRNKVGGDYQGGGALYTTANPPNWKTDATLARAKDIAVPFEIYVLIEGTGIERYLSGGENTISFDIFSGLLQSDYNSFAQASSIDVEGNTLAVSVPSQNAVYVFDINPENKNLTLQTKFVFRGEGNYFQMLQEVIINEETRKLYVLDGTRVLRLDF